jgi:AraC-like DNA-binding protein
MRSYYENMADNTDESPDIEAEEAANIEEQPEQPQEEQDSAEALPLPTPDEEVAILGIYDQNPLTTQIGITPEARAAKKSKGGRPIGRKNNPDTLSVYKKAIRAKQMLDLRLAGNSLLDIAAEFGVSIKTVARAVEAAVQAIPSDSAELLKDQQQRHLAAMISSVTEPAMKGDLRCMDMMLKLHERQAKLHGFEPSERREITGKDGSPLAGHINADMRITIRFVEAENGKPKVIDGTAERVLNTEEVMPKRIEATK